MDRKYWLFIYIALAFTCSGLHTAYISKRDTYAMEKYTKVISIWIYIIAAITYGLAVYYFYKDEMYIVQAILAGVMIVCLPAALVTLSVATITGGNI